MQFSSCIGWKNFNFLSTNKRSQCVIEVEVNTIWIIMGVEVQNYTNC